MKKQGKTENQYVFILIILAILMSCFCITSYSQNAENEYVIVDTLIVKGNKKTGTDVILRNLLFKVNDTLSVNELKKVIEYSEQNLKDLQIFAGVEITYKIPKLKSISINRIKATITVRERWTLIIYPLYSYDNVKLGTIFLNLMDDNFFGRGYPVESFFSYNKYDVNGYMKFINVPFFNNHILASTNFYYNRYKDFVYEDNNLLYESNILNYGSDINIHKNLFNRKLMFEITTHYGQNRHFDITNLINKSTINESNFREGLGIKVGRINSDRATLFGGNLHLWYEIAPFNSKEFKLEISKKNFYRVFNKSLAGIRINSYYYSQKEKLFTTEHIRGIQHGEGRGNLGFYSNFEYRQHISHINYPTELDIFFPVFLDVGNAVSTFDKTFNSKLLYTAGFGTLFYINLVGGTLQFNVGLNIPKYSENRNLRQSIYFSITTGEFFFCSERCNSSER